MDLIWDIAPLAGIHVEGTQPRTHHGPGVFDHSPRARGNFGVGSSPGSSQCPPTRTPSQGYRAPSMKVLLLTAPGVSPADTPWMGVPQLLAYLKQWPRAFEVAVEFRHPGWFSPAPEERQMVEEVWSAMRESGIGSVISDTALRRDAVHMRMTAPFLLLRFGGYEGHPSDRSRLEAWCMRLEAWRRAGLQSVYLLVHQPDSVHTPDTCRLFAELVQDRGVEIGHVVPVFDGMKSQFVGGAVGHSGLDAASGDDDVEAVRVMVASRS